MSDYVLAADRLPPPKAITIAPTSQPERIPNDNCCRAIPTGWTRTATGPPARAHHSDTDRYVHLRIRATVPGYSHLKDRSNGRDHPARGKPTLAL
jgi:hypothetical protein